MTHVHMQCAPMSATMPAIAIATAHAMKHRDGYTTCKVITQVSQTMAHFTHSIGSVVTVVKDHAGQVPPRLGLSGYGT